MNANREKCYMCDQPATSHEHVPPKCIFPEKKDIPDTDLRAQLITVPSCDLHNSKKSKDDEFLMVSLAGILGNNSIGYRHKVTKVNRAIRNTSGRLLDAVFLKRTHYVVELKNNRFLEVIWGTPDYQRLQYCFEHIARGLYRHHFGSSFKGRLHILLGYVKNSDKDSETFIKFITHKADVELRGKGLCGSNQSVFFYQFTDPDPFMVFMIKMCFYGGVNVFASFVPEGVPTPQLLPMKLIEGGVKSFIELEGKIYEFN